MLCSCKLQSTLHQTAPSLPRFGNTLLLVLRHQGYAVKVSCSVVLHPSIANALHVQLSYGIPASLEVTDERECRY